MPNPTLSSYRSALATLLLCGVPALALVAFSGTTFFWVIEPYDGFRIYQVLLLLFLALYTIFSPQNHGSGLPFSINRYLPFGLLVLTGLIVISCLYAEHSARAIADAALWTLLASGTWAQAQLLKQVPISATFIAAVLALLPLITALFLLLSLITYIVSSTSVSDWHQSFSNIRMLDDAILPCLFLLWQRPAWLAPNLFKTARLNTLLSVFIYATSTLYLLVFWCDGARAAFLSITVCLALIAWLRRDQWSALRLPLVSLFISGAIYLIIGWKWAGFFPDSLLRGDSSLRTELWLKALDLWKNSPILGIGGDNYATSLPWRLSAHPHNLLLQLFCEWGIAGLLTLVFLVPLAIQIYQKRQMLPAFVMAAVIAICVDAAVSGALIYPISQMLGLWPLAWLIALLPSTASTTSTTPAQQPYVSNRWQPFFKFMTALAFIAMLSIHGRDLLCVNCISLDLENAPRFWQYGRALHQLYLPKGIPAYPQAARTL